MKAKSAKRISMKTSSNKNYKKQLYTLIKKECDRGSFKFKLHRYATLDGVSDNTFSGLLEDLKSNGYKVTKDEHSYIISW